MADYDAVIFDSDGVLVRPTDRDAIGDAFADCGVADPDEADVDALLDVGVDPGDALYVGDSETDLVAAERAGSDAAFVRRSHCADVELDAAPTHEVATLTELVDRVG